MVRIQQKLIGNQSDKAFFDLQRGLAFGNGSAVGYPENVRVHRHGWLAKCCVEHDVGGLSSHPGQGFQVGPVVRHLSLVLFQQYAAGGDDIFCLAIVQADGPDAVLDSFQSQGKYCGWRIGFGIEPGCSLVYALVCGLGGQDYCDQEFKSRAVVEFGGW